MTVNELRDYLAEYVGYGKGEANVMVCYKQDNPVADANCIADAVFLEWKNGECAVILQMD